MRDMLKKLRPDHYAWLHAKLALMAWAIAFWIFTPLQVADVLDWTLALLVSVSIIGGITLSIVGLFVSLSNKLKRSRLGTNLEVAGLWIALTGPAVYFIARVFLIFTPGGEQGVALAVLAYAIGAFLSVRLVQVINFRKKLIS